MTIAKLFHQYFKYMKISHNIGMFLDRNIKIIIYNYYTGGLKNVNTDLHSYYRVQLLVLHQNITSSSAYSNKVSDILARSLRSHFIETAITPFTLSLI